MKKLLSINPTNNELIGEVNVSSEIEIQSKVIKAHLAKKKWKAMGVQNRIEIIYPLIEAFKKREEELTFLTINEMGKTISETKNDFLWDFDYFREFLNKGSHYIEDEITIEQENMNHRITYLPRGVTACIVPWNFPFANFVWSVIPNLIVGNTVVFKHSEECPLIGKIIEEEMNKLNHLPEGVFSEIYGDGEVGEILIKQSIDLIWFTGSSAVGAKIYEMGSKKLIKSILEMGGSNPAIIFDDVDVDNIIPLIYKGRFTNCGQVCDAIKRLIVNKKIYPLLVEKLKQYVEKIKIGDPRLEETELGPLAAKRQVMLLETQVNKSINQGAKIITGGARIPNLPGAYYLPTLIENVTREMPIWHDEIFGPVLPIVSFENEEEAIQLANDSQYGLGALICSEDLNRARRVARQLECGFVDINNGNHWQQCNPFAGHKASGMGSEHGRHGFQELCLLKVIAEG